MLLSNNKLKSLGIELTLEELSKSLFQLGHEVEEIKKYDLDNIVIGKIEYVEPHPDSDKLNVCKVSVGEEVLQIVCGAHNVREGIYVIVALEGAHVNGIDIKPIKLRGVDSCGMICSLEELGFSKDKLHEEDYNGIHIIEEEVNVGDDALKALGIEDEILDVFLTANRGDCQSYRGIYNDLKALINYNNKNDNLKGYEISSININEEISNPYTLKVDKEYSEYFSHYYITGINTLDSMWEDKLFLLKHGIKSQNYLTDKSNINLLQTGLPSHVYDADKLVGGLELKVLDKEEEFKGLDEKELMLPVGTLVICDDEKIVSIAGVMGSYDTKVTDNTKNILVEVASFDSKKVFNSSKVIKKKTEAAFRYEKGIDLSIIQNVAKKLISEILENNKNAKVSNCVCKDNIKEEDNWVRVSYKSLNKILGITIEEEKVRQILSNLSFELKEEGDSLLVLAPKYRKDISIENDLIEEVIRVYNIDNIKISESVSLFVTTNKIIQDNKYYYLKDIEDILLMQGLNQVVTYSLIDEKQSNEFGYKNNNHIKLMSPLSSSHAFYRQSLLPSLLSTAKENYSYQQKSLKMFELAQTYTEQEGIVEEIKLSALISGEYQNVYLGAKRKYDFYDLKGYLENLFLELNITDWEVKPMTKDIEQLNPYSSGEIFVGGESLGVIGEVVFDYFPKLKESMYVFELSVSKLIDVLKEQKAKKYEKINLLPFMERDLTIDVDKEISYKEISNLLKGINYLNKVSIMDIYEGEHVAQGKKSITIRLVFEDKNSTLKSETIDKEMENIFDLCDEKGFVINGR